MEEKLRALVETVSEEKRAQWALKEKQAGKKVIGVLSAYVPEEVILAAGMVPWRVAGSWRSDTSNAMAHRDSLSCLFATHVLEALLDGELDFLDGVVASDRDQDLVRMWDVWVALKKTPFCHIVSVPMHDSALAVGHYAKEARKLARAIERFGNVPITDDALRQAIAVYNKSRHLLQRLYESRKREVPPVSGAETLGITMACQMMPKEQFNRELEALFPYLLQRRAPVASVHPRLMVSSDNLDNPAYLKLVEDVGCLIAMDDLDTGSRWFWQEVDLNGQEPFHALAKRYLTRPACPNVGNWDAQADQDVTWVREYKIDGVLELSQLYSIAREFRGPYFADRFKAANIPHMNLRRQYYLADEGPLRTRVQAFLEMITSR